MKLAYFSPLNPQPSGISDYSEELLPYLAAEGVDIALFVDGFQPTNIELLARFSCFDYRRDPSALEFLKDSDAIVYHMGNDHRYHAGIFDVMRRYAGVVVLHDFALQDFFLGLARERNDMRLYLDEMAACHGERERALAQEQLHRGSLPHHIAMPLSFPLNRRLARNAEGIIAHSEWGRVRLAQTAPTVPVAHINMPVNIPVESISSNGNSRTAHHQNEGQRRSDVSIASFGLIIPGKGIEQIIRVLARLRADYNFHYTLVGAENPYFDVREIIRAHNMTDRVSITGHVSLAEFERRIAETDIALNIRERSVGETSASLCRIMAAGVASVVADVGWYAELPNDCTVKIAFDARSDELLMAYLRRLIEDAPLRERIGENARRHILAEHRIERAAANYLSFIKEIIDRRPQRNLIAEVSSELSLLGVCGSDESLMRGIASDIGGLFPGSRSESQTAYDDRGHSSQAVSSINREIKTTHRAAPVFSESSIKTSGRLPKIAGFDYKRAAIEYLGKLSEERRHHLRTKPFYNLAHKPAKYKGEGMEEDMHRHFCDFANMAMELALPPGSRILDVGCGSGWLSEYFARLGYYVKGIDISPDLIEMSRERVARVPYGVDHVTQLVCVFEVHDIEAAPLREKFDAILCYDSLHHFEDEHAVMRHLAAMLPIGGQLFVLEGERPSAGSLSEGELHAVMREFKTLESPFESQYLRGLLDDHGFAVVGDYVSVNGFFEREILEGDLLPLKQLPTNHNYLICKKVCEGAAASTVPDSRNPRVLAVRFFLPVPVPNRVAAGAALTIPLAMENTGDTLWLTGQTVRAGIVMPAVRVFDDHGVLVTEFHGEPLLPRAVAPGETVKVKIEYAAPRRLGAYTMKIDLVDQHVCWFEQQGSEPLVLRFNVV
jgi:2-polyprenyl-3-methyl-5-hydroxy-6-metoxy-1,4-benzoquinol methylase/glycosyltransferase involved in cell wall biosynthesis